MKTNAKQLFYWTPKGLAIVYAIFLSVFALDVFDDNATAWETTFALLMHLIPTCVIVATLLVAWRWELAGAALFATLALGYIVWSKRLDWSMVIAGPIFIVSLLFFLSWRLSKPSPT